MTKKDVIQSVLGFNLNADIKYKDANGIEKSIMTTCTTTPYTGTELPRISTNVFTEGFFNNYNAELLDKIRDYQRKNH
jgi:hypothetical protein